MKTPPGLNGKGTLLKQSIVSRVSQWSEIFFQLSFYPPVYFHLTEIVMEAAGGDLQERSLKGSWKESLANRWAEASLLVPSTSLQHTDESGLN